MKFDVSLEISRDATVASQAGRVVFEEEIFDGRNRAAAWEERNLYAPPRSTFSENN